ncbi:C4-type zinc ribbon domain-containing protein [Geomonas sp. RF6]|uniref:zinc ribbon domain-containing protein n=1 Tax=Geomonas sp. RF6 TaxID=2897342 RepID=UPI001E391A5D|nr:C4-type zinc ribbon domain-containing protein [Geomonas sp. RF6]UFS71644.1 C4-type zinc ribbon domain-containing protein [Geomonas sp. RF6]
MRNKLRSLYELQEMDLRIDGLDGEKAQLLREVATLEALLADSRRKIEERRQSAQILEEEKAGLEAGLSTENDNITRSETNLREIKTQKEYQAVSKEISGAKKLISELEEQILQKITALEEISGDIARKESDLAQLEANVAAQQAEVKQKVDELEARIAADAAARETTLSALPASVVKRYTRLREQRRGVAVVEAREGNCMGCNMHLPPQLYNTLFRQDDVITCPHCQRILVMRPQQEG